MANRKYARTSDTNITRYECSKKKCKWQGTLDEQSKVRNKDGWGEDYVCPKCGNPEFLGLI